MEPQKFYIETITHWPAPLGGYGLKKFDTRQEAEKWMKENTVKTKDGRYFAPEYDVAVGIPCKTFEYKKLYE